jgi:MFS transporter, DHA1 family, multidrug resistance protein
MVDAAAHATVTAPWSPHRVNPPETDPQPAEARPARPHPRRRLAISAPAVVLFLSFVDVFALLPTVAPFVTSLGGGPAAVGLAVGAYSAANLPANVVGGILVDRWGRRRVTLIGLVLAAAAVAAYPLATTATGVIVARLAHGVAGGILVPAVFAAAGDRAVASGAGRTMGRMGALIGAAAVVAPAGAGILRQVAGTTAVFLTVSGLMLVGAVVAYLGVHDPIVERQRRTTRDSRVVRELLRVPPLRRAYAATAALTVSVGVLAGFLPGRAEALGAAPSAVGGLFTAYAVAAAALMLSPLAGRVDRDGADRIAGIGLLVLATSLAALAVVDTLPLAIAATALFGVGYGLVFPAVTGATSLVATTETRGRAFGLFNAAFSIGLAFGPPIVGALAERVAWLSPFVPTAALTAVLGLWVVQAGRRAAAAAAVASADEAVTAAVPDTSAGTAAARDPGASTTAS